MKTTENFYTSPANVLNGALEQAPAAVLVVAMDDHGGITVYGSHSTPISMMLAKSAIPTIDAMAERETFALAA